MQNSISRRIDIRSKNAGSRLTLLLLVPAFLCVFSCALLAQPKSHIVKSIRFLANDVLPDSISLSSLINGMHYNSREYTIRKNLLFTEGGTIDSIVVVESEKTLRDLDYLNNVQITITNPENDSSDVLVTYHDQWSTNIGYAYKNTAGFYQYGFRLNESNLLGWGTQFRTVLDKTNLGSKNEYILFEKNALGTFTDIKIQYKTNEMGAIQSIALNNNYIFTGTKWFYNLYGEQFRGEKQLDNTRITGYKRELYSGNINRIFGNNHHSILDFGVIYTGESGVGLSHFTSLYVLPGMRYMELSLNKSKGYNIENDFENVENGLIIGGSAGKELRSGDNVVLGTFKISQESGSLYYSAFCHIKRVFTAKRTDVLFDGTFAKRFPKQVAALKVSASYYHNPLELESLTINDCRAIQSQQLWVNRKLLIMGEHRVFNIIRTPIASLGAAVFADFALTHSIVGNAGSSAAYFDYGAGLRVEPDFIGGIKMLRFDVGYDTTIKKVVFSFGTSQFFNPLQRITG